MLKMSPGAVCASLKASKFQTTYHPALHSWPLPDGLMTILRDDPTMPQVSSFLQHSISDAGSDELISVPHD